MLTSIAHIELCTGAQDGSINMMKRLTRRGNDQCDNSYSSKNQTDTQHVITENEDAHKDTYKHFTPKEKERNDKWDTHLKMQNSAALYEVSLGLVAQMQRN